MPTPMSKKEMDDYFVEILPMLEKIVKGVAYKNNKKIDTNAAINEAYLHMIRYSISTKKELEKLVYAQQEQPTVFKVIWDRISILDVKKNKIVKAKICTQIKLQ